MTMNSRTTTFVLTAALAVFALWAPLAGCGDDSPPTPADSGAGDSAMGDTGPADSGAPDTGPSTLFGPCVQDDQCPGADSYCRTAAEDGVPMGQCVARCAITPEGRPDRTNCYEPTDDLYHICWQFEGQDPTCEERCLNGIDCTRDGFTCVGQGEFGVPEQGICVPVCSSDEECGAGAECNVYTGRCIAPGTMPSGSEHGDSCADDDGCLSGRCIQESNAGSPTGWNGGTCLGPCILPAGYNSSTFYFEPTGLPQGTCPDGDMCFPNGSLSRGDEGVCLAACSSDADCRADEGYFCDKSFETASGTYPFDTGACFPIDCADTACPTGYTCTEIRTSRGTSSVCERM